MGEGYIYSQLVQSLRYGDWCSSAETSFPKVTGRIKVQSAEHIQQRRPTTSTNEDPKSYCSPSRSLVNTLTEAPGWNPQSIVEFCKITAVYPTESFVFGLEFRFTVNPAHIVCIGFEKS